MPSVKSALKHVVPPPTDTFLREMEEIRRQQRELSAQMEQLSGKLDRLFEAQRADMHDELAVTQYVLGVKMDEYLDPSLYENALKQWYLKNTGHPLDLANPRTFNEKIQWAKLYDRDPMRTQLADKYAVRRWVAERVGEEYLIPLLAVYDDASEIDFASLPDQFVLKANHGCGYNAIVRDKASEDLEALRQRARGWLWEDFSYRNGFELQYHDIVRKLIVEEYVEAADGDTPDYKLWCFDGKVHYIEYLSNRGQGLLLTFFDTDWNAQSFRRDHPRHPQPIPRPKQLERLIEVAERLSAGFPHVRVDLYVLGDDEVKFGEMTFTSASGTCKWSDESIDLHLGSLYHLPERPAKA